MMYAIDNSGVDPNLDDDLLAFRRDNLDVVNQVVGDVAVIL